MGKILGKSALCFAGLVIASWLVQKLCDWMFFAKRSMVLTMIWVTVLQYIFWFLLLLAYAYLLFYLFRHEKHCRSIIRLHGLFLIIQFLLMLLIHSKNILPLSDKVLLLSATMANVFGFSIILLSVMFTYPKSGESVKRSPQNKMRSYLMLIAFSTLCVFVLTAFSYGYDKLHNYFSYLGYIGLFLDSLYLVVPLCAITYAFCLYRFYRGLKHPRLLIILNSVFLMIVGGLTLLFANKSGLLTGTSHIMIAVYLSNTAIVTPVLAVIFHSVDKHKPALTENLNSPDAGGFPAQ